MPKIQLQSSEGESIVVDIEVAKQSNVIKTMLEGARSHSSTHSFDYSSTLPRAQLHIDSINPFSLGSEIDLDLARPSPSITIL